MTKTIVNPFTSDLQKIVKDISELDIPVVTKTTTYQILTTDHRINCDASGGGFTVTLPAIADVPDNKIFHIKKVDSSGNVVTISQGG